MHIQERGACSKHAAVHRLMLQNYPAQLGHLVADAAVTVVIITYAQGQSWPAHCFAQGITQHADGQPAQDSGATDPESAAKRRRRSEDKDVSEAAAAADADGAPAAGPKPVNGHAVTAADGSVPPEAAFWTALEDAKDEVRDLMITTILHNNVW